MTQSIHRIGIVAPATPITPDIAERVRKLATERYGEKRLSLTFHPQCFLSEGHFAGPDDARAAALIEMANSPDYDSIWFARGGYGSCRVAQTVLDGLTKQAHLKTYLGYSDMGFLLAGLYARGIGKPVHGPMPVDITREGGDGAVIRALDYLVTGAPETLDPSAREATPIAAFNITVLSQLLGTDLEPDLSGHVIALEDVSEYLYSLDRHLFHITGSAGIRRAAGLRLGRCSDIPENDRPFGKTLDDIITHWCGASGLAYLGTADIGHDSANKIVPFGRAGTKMV